MKILVTGGAGYIGSHVCKELANCGYTPIVYDNLSSGHKEFIKWGKLIEGDILDGAKLCQTLENEYIEAVVHLASFIEVGESVKNPAKYYRNNVLGTLTLLEAMRDAKVKNIVFSSSAAIYGIPETSPIKENCHKNPISPYGESKYFCEMMLESFRTAHGINSASLRYFNASGADKDGEIGEDHSPETHIIPLALDVALGKKEFIKVFGNDYPTPDGSCVRDYIHVSDLAQAHVLALEKIIATNNSFTVNLGTGRGVSVMEVIEAARTITSQPIPVKIENRRVGDPAILMSDNSLATEILGWQPQRSDINTIILDAWNWHKKRFIG